MSRRGQLSSQRCPIMGNKTISNSGDYPNDRNAQVFDDLARFNREKIVERAVHARGAGAYGTFEVTADISDVCNIDMLLGVGKKTPCVTRFSTTGLERGSAEGVRDLKGMATKFFTNHGDWDWVCLNFPFFFIRDPAKFPSLMHAQRRDPQTNLLNPNMYWDWVTENHESLHMVLLQFSDFGTMFNWRSLSSYMGHAYKWVMPDGSFNYVHIFLSSDRGVNFTSGEQAAEEKDNNDPDQATRDLYEAIERGEYPSWTANIQVVDPKDAPKLGFNILDVTKHWNLGTYPSGVSLVPPRPFGKLTLNRNVQNYDSEVEQLAFSPGNLVPGVEASEDPVLQARMFAYPDAQQYRLGTRKPPVDLTTSETPDLGPEFAEWVAQTSSKTWSQSNTDDYKFAGEFYAVLPEFRSQNFQDQMVQNIVESVAQTREDIRQRVYLTFELVHPELARRVQKGSESLAAGKTHGLPPREDSKSAKL